MKTKNIIGIVLAMGILMAGLSVMAENGSELKSLRASGTPKISRTPKPSPTPVNLTCVASAVSVREASLGVAVATHQTAIANAYNSRASALATAYAKTTTVEVKTAVKSVWASFKVNLRLASKDWKTAKSRAWATYKTAIKACRDVSGVNDWANAGHEMVGN